MIYHLIKTSKTMAELTVRKYEPGDEREINALHNAVFGTNRSLETWRWKYDRSPRAAIKLIYVLESAGQLVGQYANLMLDVRYRGQTYLVAQPVDVAIHPDYRGRRLIVSLFQVFPAACRAAGIPFGFGFPNEMHYRVGKEVLGYRDVGDVLLLRRYLNPGLLLARLARSARILDWTRPLGNKLVQALYGRRLARPVDGLAIERIASFDKRFDAFWERMADAYPVMVARHRGYLNWRYVERPDVEYTIYTATQKEELQGYIVLAVQQRIVRQGLIADLLAMDDTITKALLQQALHYFLAYGADMVSCWALPETDLHRALLRLGFLRRRVAAPLVCMVIDSDTIDEAFLCNSRNWYVTMGDSDGV